MPQQFVRPDIAVYVCCNCLPPASRLPRQWTHQGAHVVVREVPCSGKMDGQYLMHGLEGGQRGVCVVACPISECHLGQGNYRAVVRVSTVRRLLAEIGLKPERAELVHCSPNEPPEQLERAVNDAVERICALGESPLRATSP